MNPKIYNTRMPNKTKKIRKYKGGEEPNTPTPAEVAPSTDSKPTVRGRLSNMGSSTSRFFKNKTQKVSNYFGFNKNKNTDPSNNPVDASNNPVDASNNPVDASNNPVDASNNPVDASNNPVDASNNPVDASNNPVPANNTTCNCQAGAIAAAAGADQVAKAVAQPVKRITKDVGEAITDIGGTVGQGMVKIGSQMLGALPFVGAIFDLGNAANSFTAMIKKSVKPAKKIVDSMSKASTDIQKNIDNAEKTPPDVAKVDDVANVETEKPAKLTMSQRLSSMGSSAKNKTKKLFGFKKKDESNSDESAPATGGGSNTLKTGGRILRRVDMSFKQFENPLGYYHKKINTHKTRRHFNNNNNNNRHNFTRKH